MADSGEKAGRGFEVSKVSVQDALKNRFSTESAHNGRPRHLLNRAALDLHCAASLVHGVAGVIPALPIFPMMYCQLQGGVLVSQAADHVVINATDTLVDTDPCGINAQAGGRGDFIGRINAGEILDDPGSS